MKNLYQTSNQDYRIKDLYEAAFLYSKGKKLLRLEKEDSYFLFVFGDRHSCEELANVYWAGDSVVNAKEYSDSIRSLKDRLFAQR